MKLVVVKVNKLVLHLVTWTDLKIVQKSKEQKFMVKYYYKYVSIP